ncbi:hypothetical protein [Mycobacterium asiaticum]|uniref:hypothetical protein n=1 Tax=Mycobacterium asiaticum TaxID=1790 RepID=UPI000562D7C5|nr:hypothetical protein [Mycobacterium asiaticum]OBI93007.1 hypothetical protein A5661_24835 [Mycobacterium asiaticum]ORA15225.1 hypothetical protein BST16_09440 [Mycobacterium asiaticum DSM 44297]
MIRKVLSAAAIALAAAMATANPAGADPSVYGGLSCGCESGENMFPSRGTMREQIDTGIENGLSDLLGDDS